MKKSLGIFVALLLLSNLFIIEIQAKKDDGSDDTGDDSTITIDVGGVIEGTDTTGDVTTTDTPTPESSADITTEETTSTTEELTSTTEEPPSSTTEEVPSSTKEEPTSEITTTTDAPETSTTEEQHTTTTTTVAESSTTSDDMTTTSTSEPSTTTTIIMTTTTTTAAASSTTRMTSSTTSLPSTTTTTTIQPTTESSSTTTATTTTTDNVPASTESEILVNIVHTLRLQGNFSTISSNLQDFKDQARTELVNLLQISFPVVISDVRSGSIIVEFTVINVPESRTAEIEERVQNVIAGGSFLNRKILSVDVTTVQDTSVISSTGAGDDQNANSGGNSSGIATGAIVGIAVGGAAVLIVAIALAAFLVKRHHDNSHDNDIEKPKIFHNNDGASSHSYSGGAAPAGGAVENQRSRSNFSSASTVSPTRPGKGWSSADLPPYSANPAGRIPTANDSNLYPLVELHNIVIERKIGHGKFGDVYRGIWNGTTVVALKTLKPGTTDTETLFVEGRFKEAALLMRLNHPNIVRALGIFNSVSTDTTYLVMEYLSRGSLLDFVRRPTTQNKLNQADQILMSLDIAAGMSYLEKCRIVHRDLALRNLLITKIDSQFVVKIADLGLSRRSHDDNLPNDVFPVRWSPPEVMQFGQFSHQSDVWSFGVVLFELFEFGREPYLGWSNQEVLEKVVYHGYRLPKPARCPNEIYEIMLKCWEEDPNQRPRFAELVEEISKILPVYRKVVVNKNGQVVDELQNQLQNHYLALNHAANLVDNNIIPDLSTYSNTPNNNDLYTNTNTTLDHYMTQLSPLSSPGGRRTPSTVSSSPQVAANTYGRTTRNL